MMDLFNYHRRHSSVVEIGNTPLGGAYPIRIQSMANTSTLDTEGSVAQCIRIVKAGAAYVRFTAQGVREAENLLLIKEQLRAQGIDTPLVADIHFNPKAADVAATTVEKVRINPGNFVDSARTFKQIDYTDQEYALELERLRARFLSFLEICRTHHTAIRIGVNHGSLSDRIMCRYGDTPAGMVESCMEFLRICNEVAFDNVVISIKASNTVVMVETVRRLVEEMEREGMSYPLHLGVTEAGDGEDGRIKSAVGIGALLADGIGDTIRVSLSEAPEAEVPVATLLAQYVASRAGHEAIVATPYPLYNPTVIEKRATHTVGIVGGAAQPVVATYRDKPREVGAARPDLIIAQHLFDAADTTAIAQCSAPCKYVKVSYPTLTPTLLELLKSDAHIVLIATSTHANPVGELRALFHTLMQQQITAPLLIALHYHEDRADHLQIKAGADYGALLLGGLGDGILLSNSGTVPEQVVTDCAFGILQAARWRFTKTEYISCPSCGRTLFDIEKTIAEVKAATSHLKGLKIGIMGCIVNGPGEMADADFGYVGAGRGKVSLYRGKECLEKNIPQEEAIDKLIALIKSEGKWIEKGL